MSPTLGLVVPDIGNPFFAEIARGAGEAAHAAGYGMLLCNTGEDAGRELMAIRMLAEKQVDGLALCSSRLPGDELAAALGWHAQVVLINCRIAEHQAPVIAVDDGLGAQLAVQHLLASGRHRLAFVAGPVSSQSGRERSKGFAAAINAAGLRVDPVYSVPCAPYLEGGRSAVRELLTYRPGVDAVFCFNDLTAVGALQACVALGRRVPDDVAIVGSDDIPMAALVTPALTTLRVNKYEIGSEAVRKLLALIASATVEDLTLRPELVVRASAP